MVGPGTRRAIEKYPQKERQEAWLRVARKPYTEEERDAARGKLVQLLDKMEEALAPYGWLVGKACSIADIAAVPFVKRSRRNRYLKTTIPGSPNGGLGYRRERLSRERILVRS
jgi:glutathione S-transferase